MARFCLQIQNPILPLKDAVEKGIHAGKIIKEVTAICGGSGGGKPDMAQGGGKDASKIDEALSSVEEIVKGQLN